MISNRMGNLRGVIAMVLAMGVFIASDSTSKLALASVPMFEVIAIRGFFGMLTCLGLVIAMGFGGQLPRMFNKWVVARGLCEVVANVCFTLAIMNMPLADVTSIAQTAPLLVLLGTWLFWREVLSPLRIGLIVLGLTGALLVAQPGSTAASPFAVLGIVVALAAAGRDLITRNVPAAVPAPVAALTVLCALTFSGLVGTALFETRVLPAISDLMLIILAGVLMAGGQVGVFLAYKIGPARSVAPFMYSLTVWALLFGMALFGDFPNLLAIVGMALVLLAGLLIILADSKRMTW